MLDLAKLRPRSAPSGLYYYFLVIFGDISMFSWGGPSIRGLPWVRGLRHDAERHCSPPTSCKDVEKRLIGTHAMVTAVSEGKLNPHVFFFSELSTFSQPDTYS